LFFPFNGNAGFLIQRVIRPYTRVYKEVALELKWHFNNRLNIDAHYERNTRNVILSVPVSAASGVTNVLKNGKLSTKGLEQYQNNNKTQNGI
jgi:hypothetical protein